MKNPKTINEFKAAGHHGIAEVIVRNVINSGKSIEGKLDTTVSALFTFVSSPEGGAIWYAIVDGDYSKFYEKYPQYHNPERMFAIESTYRDYAMIFPDKYHNPEKKSDPLDILPKVKQLTIRKKLK